MRISIWYFSNVLLFIFRSFHSLILWEWKKFFSHDYFVVLTPNKEIGKQSRKWKETITSNGINFIKFDEKHKDFLTAKTEAFLHFQVFIYKWTFFLMAIIQFPLLTLIYHFVCLECMCVCSMFIYEYFILSAIVFKILFNLTTMQSIVLNFWCVESIKCLLY